MTDTPRFAMPPSAAAQAQVERTRLAWRRTGLTMTVVVAIGARGLVGTGFPVARVALAMGLAAALLALTVVSQRRIRELTALQEDPARGDVRQRRRQPTMVAMLVLGLAVVAVLDVVLLD